MGKIIVTDRDGETHELSAAPGLTVMEVLRDAGQDIEAICGGQCICSTCHVYIDEDWMDKLEPREEMEQVMVEDTGHYEENSRLSCQIDFDEHLDGLRLTLAPQH